MTVGHIPTPEQKYVIDLDAADRAFVVAGPGAGKTWTLLMRAGALVAERELSVSSVLMLSFTRAVVRELRKRDRQLERPSRLRPETFDSFASRLLREHADDEAWITAGFDGRIQRATALVEQGAADSTLNEIQHIFLDEIQDLVPPRSGFVEALLANHRGGFSAFGDPAQAIYDHERGREDGGFLRRLEGMAGTTTQLTGNHRTAGPLAATTGELRATLLGGNGTDALAAATSVLLDLDTFGGFDDLADLLKGEVSEAAVLCRDNATALLLSKRFHEAGVPHWVRQGTGDRPVAGWVAALIGRAAIVTETSVRTRHAELSALRFPSLPGVDEAWETLSRLDPRSRGGGVRISEVGSRVAVGRVPWELYDEGDHELVISSVHRAKGLEFDACFVVNWECREEWDQGLEARVLYVALTRARNDCFSVDHPGRRRWFRNSSARDRFIKLGREDWQTFGIEVRGDDVHGSEPGGSFALDADPAAIQKELIEQVRPGDSVELRYLGDYELGYGRKLPARGFSVLSVSLW